MNTPTPTLAIIGGTGAQGSALAKRWANAGYTVLIGSRSADSAIAAATALNSELNSTLVQGMDNTAAARQGDIIVLTVPYTAHASTLTDLKPDLEGKIVVDCTVPLQPPHVMRVQLPSAGSAAMEAQGLLGEGVRVVSAFQNVAAERLADLSADINCDVLVTGNDKDARETVVHLAAAAGMTAYHAGRLENAAAAEALTSILIFMNKHYKAHGAGIRITNLL
jgi:8-hydroxy-5-deazaflavin:NADPH oxidoreductase